MSPLKNNIRSRRQVQAMSATEQVHFDEYQIKATYSGITADFDESFTCFGKYISVVDSTRMTLK